jgi:hypothetical protein
MKQIEYPTFLVLRMPPLLSKTAFVHNLFNLFFIFNFLFRRIRDSLKESHVKTRIQQVDAASFTLGVAVSYLTEWIVLRRPTLFPNYFYILMAVLLINRYNHWW